MLMGTRTNIIWGGLAFRSRRNRRSAQGGGGYPSVLDDGNTVAWFDYTKEVTSDSENRVSSWDDWRDDGTVSLTQSTDNDKPLNLSDGIHFDGDGDFLFSGSITYEQPCSIYLVVNQFLWASYRHIMGGGAAWDGSLMQRTSSPNLTIRSSSEAAENTDNSLYEYQVIRVVFNGANSSIQINTETPSTGNAGGDDLDGITLGAIGGGSTYYSNITIKEAIFRSGVDSESNSDLIYNYLNNKYDGSAISYKYFQVDTPLVGSDKGIVRIHDLINDDSRNSIWGVTRSEDYINYVFKMNKDSGAITKESIMYNDRKNMGMFLDWGGGSIWIANIAETVDKVFLIKVNPNTMARTYYQHSTRDVLGSCLTYHNGFVYVGHNKQDDGASDSYVVKFDVENETYEDIVIPDTRSIYWAVHDGTDSWFTGSKISNGNACLIKVEEDKTYTVYDLGVAALGGGELSFDGRYLWNGSNNSTNMVKFDTTDNSIDVLTMPSFPRLNADNGDFLFCVSNGYTIMKVDKSDDSTSYGLVGIPDIEYSHGLCLDSRYAFIGSWEDECFIYRVPIDYNT